MSGQDTVENNKRILERCFTEIWNNGNLDAAGELVHPNIVRHHERNQDEDLHGLEEFRAWISQTRQAFPDLRLTIEQIFGEADRVMAHMRGERLTRANSRGSGHRKRDRMDGDGARPRRRQQDRGVLGDRRHARHPPAAGRNPAYPISARPAQPQRSWEG